ncbi:MAG: tyrosine-type recombinase/integrase [Flavobacteriales bacterium]|nr:tyrosine-type recombinase/integrase [Flavobacteriales bacterium]
MSRIDLFLQYLRSEKRSSEHTVKSYATDLGQFQDYLASQYEIDDLTTSTSMMIRSWLADMKSRGISAKSMHRKRSSLSSYFKFARKQGWADHDPVKKTVAPKMEKRLPVFASEDQMGKLLDEVMKGGEDFSSKRDHLMVTIFYETGIRLSELIGIKMQAIDFQRGILKVLGKRNKERLIPLSKETLDLTKDYIESRQAITGSGDAYLLCTDRGAKLYPNFVYRKVNSYLGKVSSLDKRSPHVLRHTFATHMLNNGAQLNTVKELLGHANLSATQVYTHNTIEKLKNIHEQKHPKG